MNSVSPFELMPPVEELLKRYRDLCEYVGLTADDIVCCQRAWSVVRQYSDDLVEDFYGEILRHAETAIVLREGGAQVDRLKVSLAKWLEDLFSVHYDAQFLTGRWIIGWRHVQIGLPQMWTAVAMSRLKQRLLNHLSQDWRGSLQEFQRVSSSIGRLIDLDLAMIQDAYHAESVAGYLKTEKKLSESIISTTQSIVLLIHPQRENEIVRGNRFLAQLVCDADELPPSIRQLTDLIPESDMESITSLLRLRCSADPCGPVVTRLLSQSGRERKIRWFTRTIPRLAEPLAEPGEDLQMLVGHDISDLVDAQQKAVQQERLAAIGQTMAGLAHESRNAFQRSQAALETLALDLEDRPDSLQLVERIQRANDHLLHLYNEVLQFAKPMRLDLRKSHLPELIHLTVQHIVQAGHAEEGLFRIEVADDLPPVMVDPYATEQILRNLIENAIAETKADQRIEIQARRACKAGQAAVRIDIRDWGRGIPDEFRERVFEPFFSTRPRGTGLGLPIARRLAESHGGSLELSPASPGTLATLELLETATLDQVEDPENQPDVRRAARRREE